METKVKTTNRVLAYILDIALISLVVSMINSIKFINPNYDNYIEAVTNYNEISDSYVNGEIAENDLYDLINEEYYNMNKYAVIPYVVIIISLILYFGVFQKFNNGQTLGKKIMHIKVVGKDNENPSLIKYLVRLIFTYFIEIGALIPIILNIILLFILKGKTYLVTTISINVMFLMLSIVSLILVISRKDGKAIHDLVAGTKVVSEKEV